MRPRSRPLTLKLLTTAAVVVGIGAAIVAATAGGEPTVSASRNAPGVRVAALASGDPTVPGARTRALLAGGLDGFEAEPDRAVRIPAPGAPTPEDGWILIPATDGVCLDAGNDALACTSAARANEGNLISIEPQMTTAPAMESQVGRDLPYPTGVMSSPLSGRHEGLVRGIAPDGLDTARAVDHAGETLVATTVRDNAYLLRVPDLSRLAAFELTGPEGAQRTIPVR